MSTTAENITVNSNKGFWASENGKKVIIGGVFIILLIIIGVYFYKQGSNQVKQAALPANDATGANLTDGQISQMAASLYNDMKGISWGADHNEDLFNTALALGNYDFVRLYNTYNLQYQQSSGKSMYAMIQSCLSIPFSPWSSTKSAMLEKLAQNNITS